jgi:hypothetical protein
VTRVHREHLVVDGAGEDGPQQPVRVRRHASQVVKLSVRK